MNLALGVSKDTNEFLISSIGDNPYFLECVRIFRNTFYGRFKKHNIETVDGRHIKNPWVFDLHLAYSVCDAVKKLGVDFIIPAWVEKLNTSAPSKDFKRFRAVINPELIKAEWKGEYQRDGVLRGLSQNRLALFWEMGLGKTFVIQSIVNHLIASGRINKYFVVAPPEGVINIARECIRFSSFGLTWDDIYIVDIEHRRPFDFPDKKLYILTYRNLIMLHDDAFKAVTNKKPIAKVYKNYIPWDQFGNKLCLILDESHNIKNYASKTFKIVDRAKSFFEYRYILSGTPATKYAQDLWTQMRFLHEDSVNKNYLSFLTSIADVGSSFSMMTINYYKEEGVKRFIDSTSYLVDRKLVLGNIELPPVVIDPVYCRLPPKQEQLYRKIVSSVITLIKEDNLGRVTRYELQSKFPYLTSVLHDPCVIKLENLAEDINKYVVDMLQNWSIKDNGKFSITEALLDTYIQEGRKVILWSGHPKIIDELYSIFSKYRPHKLHGQVVINKNESVSERNSAVCDAFLNDKESFLLIANYECLSTSVNLAPINRMIFWDRSWKAHTYQQALKRSNRIGSTDTLIVNNLIFNNSIEDYQNKEIDKRLAFNADLWNESKDSEAVGEQEAILSLADIKSILCSTSA